MEDQLRKLDLPWIKRFPGVDASDLVIPENSSYLNHGAYGCYLAHRQAIREANPDDFTLILEDDVDISHSFAQTITQNQLAALAEYDIVFLDVAAMFDFFEVMHRQCCEKIETDDKLSELSAPYSTTGVIINDAKYRYDATASAYIVTPKGRRAILPFLDNQESGKEHIHAIDVFFREKINKGELFGALLVPLLVSVSLPLSEESNIGYAIPENRPMIRWLRLLSIFRRLAYAGPTPGILEYSRPYLENSARIYTVNQLRKEVLCSLFSLKVDGIPYGI